MSTSIESLIRSIYDYDITVDQVAELKRDLEYFGLLDIRDLENTLRLFSADALIEEYKSINQRFKAPVSDYDEHSDILRIIRRTLKHYYGVKWDIYQTTILSPEKFPNNILQGFELTNIPESHADASFFNYMSVESALKVISNRTLRFSSPLRYEDQFDLRIVPQLNISLDEFATQLTDYRVEKYFSTEKVTPSGPAGLLFDMARSIRAPSTTPEKYRARHLASDRQSARAEFRFFENVESYWTHFARYFRVMCFTRRANNDHMWMKYGQNGAGVCFEFRRNTPLINSTTPITYMNNSNPFIKNDEWIEHILEFKKFDFKRLLAQLCVVKSEIWGAEEESRIVYLRKDWRASTLEQTPIEALTDYVTIEPSWIESIHLGSRVTPENASKIKEALMEFGFNLSIVNA